MKRKKVSIVIPVIGCRRLPHYLVSSIAALDYPRDLLEVIIVRLQEQAFARLGIGDIAVQMVGERGPIGYSRAANIGFAASKSDFVFLVNPDVALDSLVLKHLVTYASSNHSAGIVGPVTYDFREKKKVSAVDLPGMRFDRLFGLVKPVQASDITALKAPTAVDWISGCAMLIRRDVWAEIGGFDEKLFIYWEDVDFCMRAKEKGLATVLLPEGKVWHAGSVYMSKINPEKIYYVARNGRYFIHRHSAFFGDFLAHFRYGIQIFIKPVRIFFQEKQREEHSSFLSGIVDYYRGRFGKLERR